MQALTVAPDRPDPGAGIRRAQQNAIVRPSDLLVPEAHKPERNCAEPQVRAAVAAVGMQGRQRAALQLSLLTPSAVHWASLAKGAIAGRAGAPCQSQHCG